ncbi:MAG: undecaprenyldiphospho-muramoylpentapeptide beta-N-acetylglucosaminyltransferase [Schwartzia sp.]|nr:undecaprenyldiphospho-muramoylpentapeptide beta-N-acetylglucosaminyltransferase [Schwartzia sp. (in: firmicutes)]MBR5163200.1 undecaprenyldiphospho-muramoylpentapeptide beta-N-acetylglucosaminyltransferase [Schwartzia sp. (in: firmicutes)]
MRIIVSGGGTGGHIYPALTIVRAIQKKISDAEFLYVGTKDGLEADIVPKEGLAFETVNIQGFKRSLTPENLVRGAQAFGGVVKAMGIVRRFKPDVAVGTGGYVCGPILLASSLLGIPTLIQEQNVMPGVTNRMLSRFVSCIAMGTKEAAEHFPKGKRVFTGNPIREEVMKARSEDGKKMFGLDPKAKTVLVSGGSRGARSINRAMIGVLAHYAGRSGVQILHVTGKAGYDETMENLQAAGVDISASGNLFIEPYLYNMPQALACADVAVFRAGAIGIAELTARGVPSVLVPYPFAAANHQEMNARAIASAGAARMILDRELTAERLLSVLAELLSEDAKLKRMAKAAKKLGRPKAADEIANRVIRLAKGKTEIVPVK